MCQKWKTSRKPLPTLKIKKTEQKVGAGDTALPNKKALPAAPQ
jgi:hypothetical protein